MRDPRPVTVSAYFHKQRYYPDTVRGTTIDEYLLENLASTCQWIALRHYLFEGVMATNSSVFWYEEATTDVVGWHLQWMKLAGLQLPMSVVDSIVEFAIATSSVSINVHPGGEKASEERTWVDEVEPHVVQTANEILRAHLPPVLLARWGLGY